MPCRKKKQSFVYERHLNSDTHREALAPVLPGLAGIRSPNSKDPRPAWKEARGETQCCGPVQHLELVHR